MKEKIIIFISILFSGIMGFSQNRAPSCWLKYQDFYQGDIIINTISVQSPSPTYTYYCALQWNAGLEGGGYCGIQEHPDGRNFIYSIWDPISSNEPITATYTHTGTNVENFGGEGTGLKSWNFEIGWETGQWYSFVTRTWDDNQHTMFGFWVFDHTNVTWYHLVTMDYPVIGVRFNSNTGSFIEDWLGNGQNVREIHHKEGWKRKTSDLSWNAFETSLFERMSPDPGAQNFINNYDGGVYNNEYYFMKSGGNTSPITSTSGTLLSLQSNNTNPNFDVGNVNTFSTIINTNNLDIDWTIDTDKSPQFSYHIKVYDNPNFIGNPLIQNDVIAPHIRHTNLDISALPNNAEYYIQFNIVDIFDNQSVYKTGSFIKGSLSVSGFFIEGISIYPNPIDNEINIYSSNIINSLKVTLINVLGEIIYCDTYHDINKLKLPIQALSGIFFLKIETETGIKIFRLEKK